MNTLVYISVIVLTMLDGSVILTNRQYVMDSLSYCEQVTQESVNIIAETALNDKNVVNVYGGCIAIENTRGM